MPLQGEGQLNGFMPVRQVIQDMDILYLSLHGPVYCFRPDGKLYGIINQITRIFTPINGSKAK